MMDKNPDILIQGGMVNTLVPGDEPIQNGFVCIKDGAVTAVGAGENLPPDLEAGRVLEAAGRLVMPGLVNGHCHGAMTVFRGLADDLPLMTWLNEHIFPTEAAHVNEKLVYSGVKLACAEMLLSGTTSVADAYFVQEAAVRAVSETGMRAVLAQGIIDFPAPGVPDPSKNIEVAAGFVENLQGASPLITPSVFCHSPFTCSVETIRGSKELARKAGVIMQIHAAEAAAEVEQIKSEKGMDVVHYLDSLGVLDEQTLLVHCVHITESEIELLAERKAKVCICMESNMKLASGLAPVPVMLEKGLKPALGTDGAASNNDLNMFGEMRSLALAYKASSLDPTIIPAEKALQMAGPYGAAALGWEGQVGLISPGYKADIIMLDVEKPGLKPIYNPTSHLVYSATGREVETVLVDGKILVENGKPTGFDLAETMAEARELASGIKR